VNVKRVSIVLLAIVLAVLAAGPVEAQVPGVPPVPVLPPLPETPPIPAPVTDALYSGLSTALAPAYTAAHAAMPAATAVGFALRPECAALQLTNAAMGLASGFVQAPLPLVIVLGPAFILCYASAQPGPADPVLQQVDAATGSTLEDIYNSALQQINSEVGSQIPGLAHAELIPVCNASYLLGDTWAAMPAPLYRVKPHRLACI
jgi:hypothetical protein